MAHINFDKTATSAPSLISANSDCQPSSNWFGLSTVQQCSTNCATSTAFVLAPDTNCKCCNAGWTSSAASNFKIYSGKAATTTATSSTSSTSTTTTRLVPVLYLNYDCALSTAWNGYSTATSCYNTCSGYTAFVLAPDNNCKCCSSGWKPFSGHGGFTIYLGDRVVLWGSGVDCVGPQGSTPWLGTSTVQSCASLCATSKAFLLSANSNCKCCPTGYSTTVYGGAGNNLYCPGQACGSPYQGWAGPPTVYGGAR